MCHKKHIFRRVFAFLISAVTCISFSVCAYAAVSIKETRHTKWIDRINFPSSYEEQFIGFYETLEEACDNDGVDDILIDNVTLGDDPDTTDNIRISATDLSVVALKLTVSLSSQSELDSVFNQYYPYVAAVYAAFDRDHPEVFWLEGKTSYDAVYTGPSNGGEGEYTLSILFYLKNISKGYDLRYSEYAQSSELKEAIATRDARVNTIIQNAQDEGYYTDYDKVRYFNHLLTHTNEYNTYINTENIPDSSYESYCALMGNYGTSGPVCEGYSRAMKVLCDAADIPCVLVDGDAVARDGSEEPHMWNYVQIDDGWYAVDTTWNDPVGGHSGAVSGVEREDWLLVGANTDVREDGMPFIESHPVSNTVMTVVGGITNGPELEDDSYMLPSDTSRFEYIRTYLDSYQSLEFEYGDTVTVKAKIVNGNGVAASDQTLELLYGSTVIARSNSAVNGEYTLTYDTSAKTVPTGDIVTLRLHFAGGDNMPEVSASFSVKITPTQTEIYFAYEDLINDIGYTYTGERPQIPKPVVEFSNGEEFDCNIVYYHISLYDIYGEYVLGLPKDAGEYAVIACAVPDSGDFYSYAETSNSIRVSILRRTVKVIADDKTKVQGDFTPKLTYTIDPNTPLVEGESLIGALSRTKGEDVGEYDILQNTLNNENNPNYDIKFVGATLTITAPNGDETATNTNTSDGDDTTESSDCGMPSDDNPNDTGRKVDLIYYTMIISAAVVGVVIFGAVIAIIAAVRKSKKNKN